MDFTEKILQSKRQNEALKSELQRLIDLGLKGVSSTQRLTDSGGPEASTKTESVPPSKNGAPKVPEPPTKTRSYDVEVVRRFMKEREKRRSKDSKPEESKAQKELRKKRLDELHKKSLELLSKSVKRSKSANREGSLRPDHFEVSRHKFAPNEQILASNRITSRNTTDTNVPIRNVTTRTVLNKSEELSSRRTKNTKEPVKPSRHSQSNIVIPAARSEPNFVIENAEKIPRNVSIRTKSAPKPTLIDPPTDRENLTLPDTRLEPGISKSKNLPCIIHSNNFPPPEENLKSQRLPRNEPSIHSIHSNEAIPHNDSESNYILSNRDTLLRNVKLRRRPIPETVTTNELKKPSTIGPNLHLNVPENLQNITRRVPMEIFRSNIPSFNPKVCSTNVKSLDENFKTWLHDSHDQPFNFVDTIKRKLDFTNVVDVGTQDSFPALDGRNIENLNLVNDNDDRAIERESDTSDTSKNIPDISMESGRSLKLNAESVKRNLSREFNSDDRMSFVEEDSKIDLPRSNVCDRVRSTSELVHSRPARNCEVYSKSLSEKITSQALCSKQYSQYSIIPRNKHQLKFEAEFHLLDAFRKSLLNYSALEKFLTSLKNQNNVDISDIVPHPSTKAEESSSLQIHDIFEQSLSPFKYSDGSVSRMSMVLSDRAEGGEPTNDFAAFSVQMYEQLIKDEESRMKNLQTNMKIREKVLLDRTKTELSCLEIERKNFKAQGNIHKASVIKKKQRAIILNHQKEQHEIKMLKQMQQADSEKRKTSLRQQEHLIKKQFCMEDVARKMRSRKGSRERRRSGPFKIPDSMSAMSEVSMSRGSIDVKSNVDSGELQLSGSGKDSDTQMVVIAINKQQECLERKTGQLKKILLMHEETLEKRRKATEDLLKWHRRLNDEEKRVNDLESKANAVISRRKILFHENEKKHTFTGKELNQMWYTLTDNEEVKFTENKVYSLSQSALEKFCKNAKEHLMKAGRGNADLSHLIDEFKGDVQEEQRYQDESFEVDTEATEEIASEPSDTDEVSTAPATDTENLVKTQVPTTLDKKQISTSELTASIATTLEDILSRTEADLKQIVAQFEIRENTTQDVSTAASATIKEEVRETSITDLEDKLEDDLKTVSSISSSQDGGDEGRIGSIIEEVVKSEEGTVEEMKPSIVHSDDIVETITEDTSGKVTMAIERKSDPDEHVPTVEEEEGSSSISSMIEQSNEISQVTENIEEITNSPLSQTDNLEQHQFDPESQSVPSQQIEEDSSRDGKLGDESYLVNSMEEREGSSRAEEKSPKIEISDVKQRVHEIMDAHQVSKDRNSRVQDLYVTTYDLVSPSNSPDSGSPVTEKALAVATIFGNEAEELLKKQLAIEQEIKQITEQQQKEKQVSYIYVREIPNKPPPPYTPPGSVAPSTPPSSEISILPSIEEVHDIVPSCARILHKAYLSKTIETVSISENTMSLILTDVPKERFRFIFDLCKDLSKRHYHRFDEKPLPSWLKEETGRWGSKPLDPKGLESYLEDNLRELFGFEKPTRRETSIIKWSRKKRDHVDEVLVRECQDEESKWTSCEKDKKLIMDQMVTEVMKFLIEDSWGVMEKLVGKR